MTAGSGGVEGAPSAGGPARHIPVLLPQVLRHLRPQDGGFYIDATFGAGGYSAAILKAAACRVLALDRDPHAISAGRAMEAAFGARLTLAHSPFSDLRAVAERHGFNPADGVVFDLGVSSMQLDEGGRGFSFQRDGPLDMRMSGEGQSAADVVNTFKESEIADILFRYGEERRSRAIAREIVRARSAAPIATTGELAAICARVLGHKPGAKHPATRTFQALRLYVNDELGELQAGLEAAAALLRTGGRLVAVSFHSLEDRIVKQFLAERSGRTPAPSRHMPAAPQRACASFRLLTRQPVEPDAAEISANPRARSARLRAAERV